MILINCIIHIYIYFFNRYYFKVFECLNYLSDQNRNKFGVTLLTSRDIDFELLKRGQEELGKNFDMIF